MPNQSNSIDSEPIAPWHRQPWFWLVMSPLLVVLVACGVMVSLAVIYSDDRVVGNYYREGLLVNERLDEVASARRLGLEAPLRLDRTTGELILQLRQGVARSPRDELVLPASLLLDFAHPAKQTLDRQVVLRRTIANTYVGDVEGRADSETLLQRWYLSLAPGGDATDSWRIQAEVDFSKRESATLTPL